MSAEIKQRLSQLIESVRSGEIAVALKTINTILGKTKTKEKLSPLQVEVVHIIKAVCLLRNSDFGEARSLFTKFLESEKEVNHEDLFLDIEIFHWLESLAVTFNMMQVLIDIYEKTIQRQKVPPNSKQILFLLHLQIKKGNIENSMNLALRIFKETNDKKYWFVYIVYVHLSGNNNMANLFLTKLLTELKCTKNTSDIDEFEREILTFALGFQLKDGKHDVAEGLLLKQESFFNENHAFLDALQTMHEKSTSVSSPSTTGHINTVIAYKPEEIAKRICGQVFK